MWKTHGFSVRNMICRNGGLLYLTMWVYRRIASLDLIEASTVNIQMWNTHGVRFRRCSSNGWVNSTSFCLQEVTSKFYPILSGNELNQIEWTEMVLTKHTLCICCTVITLAGFPECFPASSDGTKWAPPA